MFNSSFFQFINKGGAVNWVITALYLLWFTLLIERAVHYILTTVEKNYFQELRKALSENRVDDFVKAKPERFLNPLLLTYLQNKDKSPMLFTSSLEDTGEKIVTKLERGLWVLRELGSIAPLLGLLGTVVGLIQAFAVISQMGSAVEVSDLAEGIWQAMLTTANGLILAIGAFLTYSLFDQAVIRREKKMSHLIADCDMYFGLSREKSTTFESDQAEVKAGPDNEVW